MLEYALKSMLDIAFWFGKVGWDYWRVSLVRGLLRQKCCFINGIGI